MDLHFHRTTAPPNRLNRRSPNKHQYSRFLTGEGLVKGVSLEGSQIASRGVWVG